MSQHSHAPEEAAKTYLDLSDQQVEECRRDVPEIGAVYFWQPQRGGGALLVASDGTMLYATSAIPYEVHVEAFEAGRRTDPAEFRRG